MKTALAFMMLATMASAQTYHMSADGFKRPGPGPNGSYRYVIGQSLINAGHPDQRVMAQADIDSWNRQAAFYRDNPQLGPELSYEDDQGRMVSTSPSHPYIAGGKAYRTRAEYDRAVAGLRQRHAPPVRRQPSRAEIIRELRAEIERLQRRLDEFERTANQPLQ